MAIRDAVDVCLAHLLRELQYLSELKRQGRLKMQEASQKFKAKANKQEEKDE